MIKGMTSFLMSVFVLVLSGGFLMEDAHASDNDKIKVSVSLLPQAYIVERVGGDRVKIQVMIPSGASPATYEPTPQQLVMLSHSRLYIKVGAPTFPFEKKHFNSILQKNKKMIVINMSDGIEYRPLSCKKDQKDPHVWVAPSTVSVAAGNIYNALARIDPNNRDYYKKNIDLFLADIERLDKEIKAILAGKEGYSFMVFHPAWGYFADQYGLKQIPVEVGGKTPSASNIKEMIDTAREKGVKIIFVQKGFDKKSAETIAHAIGGRVMEMNPLEKDWVKNMKQIAEILSDALRE